jgi:hypothetical protein
MRAAMAVVVSGGDCGGAGMRMWLCAGVHVWPRHTLLWIGFLIYDG